MQTGKEVVIITGASRGIGKAIAQKLAADNRVIIAIGRTENLLVELIIDLNKKGFEALYFTGDVADEYFAEKTVKFILSKYGRIDHLINNAGTANFKKFVDSGIDEFRRQIDTNLLGIYNFSKSVVGNMIERRTGTIINISSLAGKTGFVGGTMYSATKHAVMGFTKSLMLELREFNIKVCVICPGSVSTELLQNTMLAPKNPDTILDPADVAAVVSSILDMPDRALLSEIEIRPLNPR